MVADPDDNRLMAAGQMRRPAPSGAATASHEILRQALSYAAAGWPVFPCKPDQKAPDTVHGFKDATTDLAVIRAWWRVRPDRNVAIATGAPGPDVLDVDDRPEGSGWASFAWLKQAGMLAGALAIIRTPSGGLHVYFTGTDQPCARLRAHYLDFKATRGYVVAPPSVVRGGAYELLSHRAGTGVLDWQAARNVLVPALPSAPRLPRNRGGDVGALARWVGAQPVGNRNAGLYWAARRAAESGLETDALVAAAVQAGLSETEAHRTAESARRACR